MIPITGWLPALMADKVEVAGIIGSRSGNAQVMVCYRTATTSPEAPSTWTLGETVTTWKFDRDALGACSAQYRMAYHPDGQ